MVAPRISLLAVTFSIFSLAAGAAPNLSKLPPASTRTGITYAADIRPLFEVSCFRCHGADRQKGGLRLDSLEAVLKGSEDGKVVLVGESAKSPLVIAISGIDPHSAMPPGQRAHAGGPPAGSSGRSPAQPLTPEQVGLVRAWIDQGAK